MLQTQQRVKDACDKVYTMGYCQWLIDFVQDDVEPLLNDESYRSRDEPGALAYQAGLILDIIKPELIDDIALLQELIAALDAWSDDLEATNIILGLPKES